MVAINGRMVGLCLNAALLALVALACPAQTVTKPSLTPTRPEQPFSVDAFNTTTEVGGSWEYNDEHRNNFDLDSAGGHNRRAREHEVKLQSRTRWGADTRTFVQIVGLHETRRRHGDHKQVERALERGEIWIQQDRLGGTTWSLQAGRVKLLDRRGWWWDDELDAVRARYDGGNWRLDTGMAREMMRKSSVDRDVQPDARGVTRFFGQATWLWAPRHALEAFWLVQNDRSARPAAGVVFRDEGDADRSDLHARWLGLRAVGEWREAGGHRLAYWADTAWLEGREHVTALDEQLDGTFTTTDASRRRVGGIAFDVGVTASLALPLQPTLTVAHARGTSGFRQTGLQENKTRFGGAKRWQRYGELMRPELSNLAVTSLGTGVRVFRGSSIELMMHHLRQVHASGRLGGSRLSVEPQGRHRNLGREIDLLIAVRENDFVEITFKVSRFKPGVAFALSDRKTARAFESGVSVKF